MNSIEQRLRFALDPYNERPEDNIDMLLWRVGRMREQIDHAHHWLDMKGAPDGSEHVDGALTLRGRMDALDELSPISHAIARDEAVRRDMRAEDLAATAENEAT
jgi:hypothetical protein